MSLLTIIERDRLRGSPLVELALLIDWRPIADEIEPLHLQMTTDKFGGPTPWNPVLMFRASVLQDWHRLSFGALARAICVRLDFKFFAGFEPGFPVPSASSLCRARHRLEGGGVRTRCQAIVADQMNAAGVSVIPVFGALQNVRIVRRK